MPPADVKWQLWTYSQPGCQGNATVAFSNTAFGTCIPIVNQRLTCADGVLSIAYYGDSACTTSLVLLNLKTGACVHDAGWWYVAKC